MRRFLWIAFLVFDGLVLCLFAAGYVARWVDPRTFWLPQLFAIALPLFSIILLIATVIVGVAKRWVHLGTHLIVVCCICIRFFSLSSAPSERVGESNSLRVASYNLGHFENFSQAEQAKKLGEILKLLYPDIIGLQEFMVRYRGRELRIRNLPYVANKLESLGYQTVASQYHDVPTTFKPVWTRNEKLIQERKERVNIKQEGYMEMSVTRMQFEWQGRDAVFYNLHLRTFGSKKPWLEEKMSPMSPRFWLFYLQQYKEAFEHRAWQADQIHELITRESLPVIVSGDFNSTPHNWAYYRLSQRLQDVHTATFSLWQTSYHVNFPLAKIDHMMVTPEWKVEHARIPPLDYSDHRPLIAVLSWKD